MVAAKVDNYTTVVEEIDLCVAQTECLCSVYFHYFYLIPLHCHLVIVVSETGHPVEPYWLSSLEIRSSTLYVNKRLW